MTRESRQYITVNRLVSGLAAALVLVVGWLFTMINDSTKEVQEQQAETSIMSAVNKTNIDRLNHNDKSKQNRILMLEKLVIKSSTEIAEIKHSLYDYKPYN